MAAFNPKVKKKILRDQKTQEPFPCVMCGTIYPLPEAAHIIDQKEWKTKVGVDRQANSIPLCSNCHKIFDEFLRPYLHRALKAFGAQDIPVCWERNNKITIPDQHLPLDEET